MKQEMNNYAAGIAYDAGYAEEADSLSNTLQQVKHSPELYGGTSADDTLAAAVQASPDEALGHDILALAADDPVLASLIKQYLNISRQHKALMKSHGYHDPMADVAADMVDSAWCAIQTRIIELRAVRDEERGNIKPKAVMTAQKSNTAPVQKPIMKQADDFVYFLMWLALMTPMIRDNARSMAVHAFKRAAS